MRAESDWEANFGCAVAINGDTIAVGADRDDFFGVDDGAIRVFAENLDGSWDQAALLGAPKSTEAGREFGFSVCLDGDRLLGGMPVDGADAVNAGGAVLFTDAGSGWEMQAVIRSASSAEQALFGTSVAAYDGRIAMGAPLASDAAIYAGSVSVIDLNEDCDEDGIPDVIAVASGAVEDINGDGRVNMTDVLRVLDAWGMCGGHWDR